MQAARNHPINCGTATTEFARTFAKQSIADRSINLLLAPSPNVLRQGTVSNITLDYRNLRRTIGSIVRSDIVLRPEFITGANYSELRSFSSDQAVAAPTDNPYLFEYQSSGSVTITAELANGERATRYFQTSSSEEPSWDDLLSFTDGSLAKHVTDQILQRADGSTSYPGHLHIYSTFDGSSQSFVKNTGCWAADLDFSGVSVHRQGAGAAGNVTAISPFHALTAAHYAPNVGDIYYFCDSNNTVVSRTVHSRAFVSEQGFLSRDTAVVRFTQPLPASVAKYKTFPSNWADYAPSVTNGGLLWCPTVSMSHYNWDPDWTLQRSNRYAYIYITGGVAGPIPPNRARNFVTFHGIASSNVLLLQALPKYSEYSGFPSGIRGGDSGMPSFFVINGQLVLMAHWTGPFVGRFQPDFLSSINAALDALGPGDQTYQTVDLSQFTNFAS